MAGDGLLDNAEKGVEVVGAIIKAAGNDPRTKEAAANLGESAVIVTGLVKNVLLPFAAVNFAIEKAKNYFTERFGLDLHEKTASIPPEAVVEPKASIAGPVIQGLAFAHAEEELKALYLGLLATAMDGRIAASAHPAFVEVIKQINGVEAKFVQNFLRALQPQPIVEVRLETMGNPGYSVLRTHLINLLEPDGKTPAVRTGIPFIIDNWIRLGLVDVTYMEALTDQAAYSWASNRPEVADFRSRYSAPQHVTFGHGVIQRTDFGVEFAKAVGIL